MRQTAIIALLLVLLQGSVLAGDVTVFQDGKDVAVASLGGPGYSDAINLSLPAECHILEASMNVKSIVPNSGFAGGPEGSKVFLNDTLLWAFDRSGYGGLGKQTRLVDNATGLVLQSGPGGGEIDGNIRLMKRAVIENASLDLKCTGLGGTAPLIDFSEGASGDQFGYKVSGVGDVNGDGFDDVVVSAPYKLNYTGAAYLFIGNSTLDSRPNLIFSGKTSYDYFGRAVCNKCDLNGDGFDDIVIGADYGGDNRNGNVYVYYGGKKMDDFPDLTLSESIIWEHFGYSIAAGDFNGDGFDDLVVGAPANSTQAENSGNAYIFFGGKYMDAVPDAILWGQGFEDRFGNSVACAGDVNNDGFDDIIIGAWHNDSLGTTTGSAHIFFGGPNMDKNDFTPDVTMSGEATGDLFGISVSDAGDVNGDGIDDVIVGASQKDNGGPGSAYIYFGNRTMDNKADVILTGQLPLDQFGFPVKGIGDVNRDGCDDVLVGAIQNSNGGNCAGSAYVYYGGSQMDDKADEIYSGGAENGFFGSGLSLAGDMNGDGVPDIIVGEYNGSSANQGAAHVFSRASTGILRPSLSMGSKVVWAKDWFFNGTATQLHLTDELNNYLENVLPTGIDDNGNAYVDVPLSIEARGEGTVTIDNISITYNYSAPTIEFSDILNNYLSAHKGEKDTNGNISVPINITSISAGRLELGDLIIKADLAPRLVKPIPDFEIDEDTACPDLINLWQYFKDDHELDRQLNYGIVSATNSSIVKTKILDNLYLSVDAATGPLNDNWTGVVEVVVSASDRWGSQGVSNSFRVVVRNIPDPPLITSQPSLSAYAGRLYIYQVTALDGDINDVLSYGLAQKPVGMDIDATSGNITWLPSSAGSYIVSAVVTDGLFSVFQNYTVTVPNIPPRISNVSVPPAFVDSAFSYQIPAMDDNGDALTYSLLRFSEGMGIDAFNGTISWTPHQIGNFPVSVGISDGMTTTILNFTIEVLQGNRAPRFVSNPATSVLVGQTYSYIANATDPDGDPLTYELIAGPPGMTINNRTGIISWTPVAPGNFTIRLRASDGYGGEGLQEFVVHVDKKVKAGAENPNGDLIRVPLERLLAIVAVAAAFGVVAAVILLKRKRAGPRAAKNGGRKTTAIDNNGDG